MNVKYDLNHQTLYINELKSIIKGIATNHTAICIYMNLWNRSYYDYIIYIYYVSKYGGDYKINRESLIL